MFVTSSMALKMLSRLIVGVIFSLFINGIGCAWTHGTPSGTLFQALKIGGGGYLVGLDIAPDGSKVVRTDTYGAYILTAGVWRQVMTTQTMPAADVSAMLGGGVYEIVFAPSNSLRMYMTYGIGTNAGHVFRSDDQGYSWTRTAFTPRTVTPNDAYRIYGQKTAVDPINADVVYVGTPAAGVFVSTDAGANWSQVTAVGTGSPAGHTIVFDPSSGSTGGRTNRILISTYDIGVYESADAGANWTLTTNGPLRVGHMVVAPNTGKVWATYKTVFNNVRTYSSGVWSTRNENVEYHSIAIDPTDNNHIVIADGCGEINQSFNNGSTWTGLYFPGFPSGSGHRVASDVPWLAATIESCMSSGNQVFNPAATNELWFAQGIGVWKTNPPATYIAFNWNSVTAGIEQLVTNQIVSVPGGPTDPIVAVWDRGLFNITNFSAYSSAQLYGSSDTNHSIVAGWFVDYAPDNPNFLITLNSWDGYNISGYSSDGGATWTPFSAFPSVTKAGSVAAGSTMNFVWFPESNQSPYYTLDQGATWNEIIISGVPTSGERGWGAVYSDNRWVVAADKVNLNTFYAYNYGPTGSTAAHGIYRSTDGGVNWSHVFTGTLSGFYNTKLRAVPGKVGELFITGYTGTGTASSTFPRSTDGGATWNNVANVTGVFVFGFGKADQGATYPTIYIVGSVSSVYGIWRSTDNAVSWTMINDGFPIGSFDEITCIEGDANIFGKVYIGFRGSGAAYGILH